MSPSITKHKQLQKPDFQHSVKKIQKKSSSFSELSEILKSPNTYNSCAGESPGLIHAHTLRCTSKKNGKPQQAKQKKIRGTSKKPLLLVEQWVREILAFERLANMCQEKRFGITQAIFFAFLIKMQIFANVCGSPQPPSGPIVVRGGSINKAKTIYPLPSA